MSGTRDANGFWTKGKVISAAIVAMGGLATYLLGGARTVISVVDAPSELRAHVEDEAAWRADVEQRLRDSRLAICELLELFPSECPQFTIDHGDGP